MSKQIDYDFSLQQDVTAQDKDKDKDKVCRTSSCMYHHTVIGKSIILANSV